MEIFAGLVRDVFERRRLAHIGVEEWEWEGYLHVERERGEVMVGLYLDTSFYVPSNPYNPTAASWTVSGGVKLDMRHSLTVNFSKRFSFQANLPQRSRRFVEHVVRKV